MDPSTQIEMTFGRIPEASRILVDEITPDSISIPLASFEFDEFEFDEYNLVSILISASAGQRAYFSRIHAFIYKNILYKNIEAENGQKFE